MLYARILLAHHILVALQHNCRHLLLSGHGFPDNHDIANGIGLTKQATFRGEILQKRGHRAFVAGLSGNRGDLLEDLQRTGGYHMVTSIFSMSVTYCRKDRSVIIKSATVVQPCRTVA